MNATMTAGFYGTDSETYYVTPLGRVWVVASADDLGTDEPVAIDALPDGATPVDGMLTPEEAVGHCRRVEAAGGESLVEIAPTVTVTAGSELLHTLAHFVNRDDAGRHFTERYADDSVEALEALGLIAVTRPVHDATGLPYGHEHWHAEVTEAGVELVERLYDERDYGDEG